MSGPAEVLTDGRYAGALAKLHKDSFSAAWPVEDFTAHLASDTDRVIGSFNGETLIGFIVTRRAADQAEILTLVTRPDYRRLGHGAALVIAAHERLLRDGAEIVFLDVAEDNPAAIALYQRLGYQPCGRRPGYYRRENGRVAALLMQKGLINRA